jgi:hypothetical protein
MHLLQVGEVESGGKEHGALVQQILRIIIIVNRLRLGKLSLEERNTVPLFSRSSESS